MSSSMWYIMQSIQSKYSLSERLIRTIAAIRSFPHDNVEDLIRGGADVNCTHGTLKPLHCACMVSDADCVELLLEKGAEVNALDGYNRTALHYAAEKDEACVEVLLEYGANPNAL
ncbi:ASB8 isoform 10, partial [Pan troglodytes]